MTPHIPERLRAEQRAVEDQVRQAFRGVTRQGGVSWSESIVIDDHGTDEQRARARAADTERCWEDLVDDPRWDEEPGVGGFNFLDAIDFRYYIAPAMIRCVRRGGGEFISDALHVDGAFKRDLIRLLTPAQSRAVARSVRFMTAVHQAVGDDVYGEPWRDAYRYWRKWDAGSPS